MKRTLPLLLVLAASVLLAGVQDKPKLTDKKQRFALWFTESSLEVIDKDTFHLEVSGSPFHGYSKDQNLEFSATNFDGVIRNTSGGGMLVKSGTVWGSAVVTVEDANGKSTVKASKLTIDDNGETANVTIPGAFTFTNSSSSEGKTRSMVMDATRGSFVLKSLATKDENPLVSSEVTGPVSVRVDETTPKGHTMVYRLTGQRMTMRAEGTDKVLTVNGSVHIENEGTGDENVLLGTFDVDNATIVIDKDYKIKKVSTKGSPGTGTIKETKGGG